MTDINIFESVLKKNRLQIPSFDRNYKIFNNYYSTSKFTEYNVFCILNILWTGFILVSNIPFFYVNDVSNALFFIFSLTYYNINSDIGKVMSLFIALIHMISKLLVILCPYINSISLAINILSLSYITIGYNMLSRKNAKQVIELQEKNIYLGPLYAYVYLEKTYNISKLFEKILISICNYIKNFSTSDIIKINKFIPRKIRKDIIVLEKIIEDEEQSQVLPEVQSEVQPHVLSKEQTEVLPEIQSQVLPEVQSEVQPHVLSKEQTEVLPEIQSEVQPQVLSKEQSQALSEEQFEAQPHALPVEQSQVLSGEQSQALSIEQSESKRMLTRSQQFKIE